METPIWYDTFAKDINEMPHITTHGGYPDDEDDNDDEETDDKGD